ncbi:hypothetical protein CW670_02710 [Macrococcoides caseolyticum]|uniref:hypothetical protein n=1 Tax=Macrococcoides caseolyticum TaxID=69966 RepID=UPI000C31DF0B|nr:hypothetical protein [Macrococcus caseolyticus]PKE36860.1 hypothetical protein CW695_00460 [Macrococcus caseolyticus]PKE75120.1 hypothetical protein CW670_02710 [Macrococcus caseolyticus]
MTDKEKYELKIISIIFLSILIIILVSIFIWIDVGHNNNDSVTNTFLTGLNVMIMSVLTYSLLQTTKMSNDINDRLVELSRMEFMEKKRRDLLVQLAVVERYIKIAEEIYVMILRHVSIKKKYDFLNKLFAKDIPVDRYMMLNSSDKHKLPEATRFKRVLEDKNGDYSCEKSIINNLFNNSIHFNIKNKKIAHLIRKYTELKNFSEEPTLYYYPIDKKDLLNQYYRLETLMNNITSKNTEGNLNITKLRVDEGTADELMINLRGMIRLLEKLKVKIVNEIKKM